ncbi:hypothetical protein OUZ56_018746 [Daphnia magna]|uniref:Uncharacterized protein n=1 Tax=Daphnia magna TaxID=35525 RepID=A0ABQ9Z9P9_9CRUS|nr:hypothetical protein OUZ56_018746 [Daphnia magna]
MHLRYPILSVDVTCGAEPNFMELVYVKAGGTGNYEELLELQTTYVTASRSSFVLNSRFSSEQFSTNRNSFTKESIETTQ